ncbi:MAG: acyl-CoA dehydrogenase family protein, partial [Limnohabitans sp.]
MKLQFTPEEEAFRLEVREYVKTRLPADIKRKVELGLRLEHEDYVTWFRILESRGWLTPSWPVAHGGPGWSHVQRYIFDEETLLGGAPRIIASGIQMLGPVLIAYGTEEQKKKYLPDIRQSNTWWAQGFSEPGAGSDLATIRTTAVLEPDGKHFVVNGHKIWTSYAHFCDMLFCLVRTNPDVKPQEGISMLLIDARSPGVTIRPIPMLEGGTDLNEVFLDNVRVPVENVVGEVDKGWTYAKHTLGNERTGIAGVASCKQQLARLKDLAAMQGLLGDPLIRARVAELEMQTMALEFMGLKILSTNVKTSTSAVAPSILKVFGTELRQQIYSLLVQVAGPQALPFTPEAFHADFEGELASPVELM